MTPVNEITFRNLPFQPEPSQVFYIENGYDEEANDLIRSFYPHLKRIFKNDRLDFYYLPFLVEEENVEAKVRYYAPYLSPSQVVTGVQSNAFVPYIADEDTRKNLKPSLILSAIPDELGEGVRFMQVQLSDLDFTHLENLFDVLRLADERQESYYREMMDERTLSSPMSEPAIYMDMELDMAEAPPSFKRSNKINFNRLKPQKERKKTADELEEEQSLIETRKVMEELLRTVQKLRLEGVSLMAIHELIDKQEPLSRMTITPDYRIFLPDYNNMEIEMGALPKAIYFLYLRYPEGIVYKHMPDYFSELLNIYRQLRPNTDEARLNLTITKVVNPLGNALNENLARIRKAFVEKFDEHLANNYIITGERGLQYRIPLDRELITWEE